MVKLSIIVPVYNCEKYTHKLLDILDSQVKNRDDVEVIIIDDGSKVPYKKKYSWEHLIVQENGGASAARNTGLDNACGEYIAFVDGDDEVSDIYVNTIINKIDSEHFDYCYISWKTLSGGWQCDVKLNSVEDVFPKFNLCVWNRIYKRSLIGNVRFNTKKLIAEDAEFIRDVKETGKKAFISDYMYLYRSNTPDSLTKRFAQGNLNTQRVVYHYKHITKDMTYLIDEVKNTDKYAEVIILTNQNDLPELNSYAMILPPCEMKGTELRGEPTAFFKKIEMPIETQIVIWTDTTMKIGGIETSIYSFCMNMKDDYDITVLYNKMDQDQINRLQKFVRVTKASTNTKINCDTLIVNRITDPDPVGVTYKKKVRMVHCCKLMQSWTVNNDCDFVIPVSNVVRNSFREISQSKCSVINNFTCVDKTRRPALRLISATRLSFEKGKERMIKFATLLHQNQIPFVWTIFTDDVFEHPVDGMVIMKPTLNILDYVKSSDYLVQLSDSEGFCYSIVEALELGVPVITTPIEVLNEIGFKDKENGFIVPFDMDNIDVEEIFNTDLDFKYEFNNDSIKDAWRNILGNTVPLHNYVYHGDRIATIRVTGNFYSTYLKRDVKVGEVIKTPLYRAEMIFSKGVCEILGVEQ